MSFRKPQVRLNVFCLNAIADCDYVNFIIDACGKVLSVSPCGADDRDAVRLSVMNPSKRKPKIITCREFYRRLSELMGWKDGYRYKAEGRIYGDGHETAIAFNLTDASAYPLGTGRTEVKDGTQS